MGAGSIRSLLWLAPCALALFGCGVEPRTDALATAAAKTAEAGTARVVSVSRWASGGESFTFSARGVFDYTHHRSDVTYEYDGQQESRVIVIEDATYSSFPDNDWTMPPGKRWLRFDAVDAEAHACDGSDDTEPDDWVAPLTSVEGDEAADTAEEPDVETVEFEGTDQDLVAYGYGTTGFGDPGEVLSSLRETGSEPSLVGRELVRDTVTTHYRAKLDLNEALRRDFEQAGWSQTSIDCITADEEAPIDVDVWVDDDGLVRRLMSTTTSDGGFGTPMTMVETSDFFDFGLAVDVQPPAAAEVVGTDEWQKFMEENSGRVDEQP